MGWLGEALSELADMGPQAGLERFASTLDAAWIEEALTATGAASIRRRKLPAEQAVWLVLGMALFADRSIRDVVDHLGLVVGGQSVAPSNLSKARYRLGEEPLQWLFERVASAWGHTPGLGGYRGLSLYGVDGTTLRVQDSNANFDYFGKPGGRGGKGDAGYPQLRMVALMNLSNRLLCGMRHGPYARSEHELVKELWALIPSNSLTIVDRGFVNYLSFLELREGAENRHFMIRSKSNTKLEIVQTLPDGSELALLYPPKSLPQSADATPGPMEVRVITYQHEGGEPSKLITSLVDPSAYPAEELIELYHDRWELEIGFAELKTHMLERKESLRSKRPEGVHQELWGQLLAYNLVRREMLLVAAENDLPPRRISFKSSLLWVRTIWLTSWSGAPGNIPKHLGELRSSLRVLILPERRSQRRYRRHVKIKMSNFPRNRGRRASAKGAEA